MSVSAQNQPAPEAPAGLAPFAGTVRMPENLVLLSQDDSLLEALSGAVPPDRLTVVRDEAALASELLSGQAGVVFIDAGSGPDQAASTAQLTQRLHSQLPDVVLVVAGDGAAQSELAALVTDGIIYRFVHKPVSAQRVKLFVDAAWRKRDGTSTGASGQYPTLSMSQTMSILPMPGPRPWPALAAGAVVVGMAVAWYALQSAPAAPPAMSSAPAASSTPAAPIAPEPARVRAAPPLILLPVPAPVLIPVPEVEVSPLVAASLATIPDVSVSNVPVTDGPPTSTPPVSEARDPLSVAAVILERVYSVDPEFPEIAREQDLTGFVDLEFMVHADGSVSDVTVLRARPVGVFEKSAVAAIQQWRYRPIERDGIPVDEHARLRLNFGYK